MDLNEFAVDPDVYENGKKVELGQGAYMRVRNAKSDRATKVRERIWKPYATWKDVPNDILARLNADWCAQGLLTEFVGFSIGGQPIIVDLSKEADQKRLAGILKDKKYSGMRSRIIGIAWDDANYQDAEEEGIEGKSAPSPDGSSPSAEGQSS